ncbi:MAG: glycosyl transferase [Candidatus Accumulibacter sp.]|jgi:UDP:flavonoid glycosyltransferase YjiC (YdhE family)|nr:glycosyl transferase [Accumulibacter sp.]
MKFLLIPENNSLSHIGKCLSVMDILEQRGHETEIAVTKNHSGFLDDLGIRHHLLPDIQEADCGGFPTFGWFSKVGLIADCIHEEVDLIDRIRPDRVVGVFRPTLYASSAITGVSHDSLICGCMVPEFREVLGFMGNEDRIEVQKKLLANFFSFAGTRLNEAMAKFGLPAMEDIREVFVGERTFLWDFPEFLPLATRGNMLHVGPIALRHWPYDPFDPDRIVKRGLPVAVISFGTCTCVMDDAVVRRIAGLLLESGYQVIIAAGGRKAMYDLESGDPRVTVLNYARLTEIFPHASLLVTHGGQMTVFEALRNEVPVLTMPFQPEQAHNGVCLERIGCGARLIPSTLFYGLSEDYVQAFQRVSDDDLKEKIARLVDDPETGKALARMRQVIARYSGAEAIARALEGK